MSCPFARPVALFFARRSAWSAGAGLESSDPALYPRWSSQ